MAASSMVVWSAVLFFGQTVQAQESTNPATEEQALLTTTELEELVGPIALYPDALVSIVLPASTYPLQIVQAARFLEEHETNPALKPDENWDDSVVALLNYPEVIALMNADLDWTWTLGEAALYQKTELMDAIQEFRDRAYAAGNLETDDRQVVTKHVETIVIEPADPKVIYVPYYEPRRVAVYQSYPVYYYYPQPYPVYYYPYPYGYSFGSGFFWGVTLAFSIDWYSHHVHAHHYHHHAHPYYGHDYHHPWYRDHSVSVSYSEKNIWRPGYKSGSRQHHTTSVLRENRALGATSASKGKYLKRNDQRLRISARTSAKRSGKSVTAARRRKQSALSNRPVTRTQKRREKSPGMATMNSRDLNKSKKATHKTSTASTKRAQWNPKRMQSARRYGGSRSSQSSSRPPRAGAISQQRDRSSFTSPRSVPTRQRISRPASRGTRSFKGYGARGTPSIRSDRHGGFRSSARSGFNKGFRSKPSGRATRNRL
jgi:hypothetical protein